MNSPSDTYFLEALGIGRAAWSHWQREPASPSCGCFDRPYWGWKKKDIADIALQAAIVPAIRYAESIGRTETLPVLIDSFVAFLERSQHRDGSFDQMYPNEKAPGVVYDILSALLWVWKSPHISGNGKSRLESVMHKAVAYALTADEKHGEIANHFAHYAWDLANFGQAFNHPKALSRSEQYVARTLKLFNREEGWFLEYDGADAGYQTRCVTFLSKLADLNNDSALWDILRCSAGFLDRMLMPDNSFHPMLGVRSTGLTYPSGIERIALRFPEFGALADRVQEGWRLGSGLSASMLDFENSLRIADDAFEASEVRELRRQARPEISHADQELASLPDFDMPDAGIHGRTATREGMSLRLYVGTKLGGATAIYKSTDAVEDRLAAESAGYLLRLKDGSTWVSRGANTGSVGLVSNKAISVTAHFSRSLHEDLTPTKMIVLRLLNLTVLRSQWIGDLFRKIVVRRLISGSTTALPLSVDRKIVIGEDGIRIEDRFVIEAKDHKLLEGCTLHHCRRTIPNHMASSRYFQGAEINCTQPWTQDVTSILAGDRICVHHVKFDGSISTA